ncbi:hypothetical protein HN51_057409, partial [Arachis hypogaea]
NTTTLQIKLLPTHYYLIPTNFYSSRRSKSKVVVLREEKHIRIYMGQQSSKNASLTIGMCSQGQWEKVTKGSWV